VIDKKQLTAPCGLDCFNCEIFELKDVIHAKIGIEKDRIPCKGCRAEDGKHYHMKNGCATSQCVKNKKVEICSDCADFPCKFLAPLAKGADFYPHNMKVYNLCRIKKNGIQSWISESQKIRKAYYTNDFIVGMGQAEPR
jgi:hypothetical protein